MDFEFSVLSSTNSFKHLMATTLKNKAEEILMKPKKIDLSHESLKKLREKINGYYRKNSKIFLESIEKWFRDQNGDIKNYKNYGVLSESKSQLDVNLNQKKSTLALYNDLYKKVELDDEFKKNYENWAEEELMSYLF